MTITIPTPTTDTNIIDAQQVTRTTWTVGDHTLTRIEREDAGDPQWTARNLTKDAPRITESSLCHIDPTLPVTYDIDWSSSSDNSPESAFEYASRIMAAAHASRVFATIRAENN